MCVEKSEIEVAPRGRGQSASGLSLARRDESTSKWRTMRCMSESGDCRICEIQCTSSTYGLPRSLQNTVALSMALNATLLSFPNDEDRLISLMRPQLR